MSALSFYSNPMRKRGVPRFPSLTLLVTVQRYSARQAPDLPFGASGTDESRYVNLPQNAFLPSKSSRVKSEITGTRIRGTNVVT